MSEAMVSQLCCSCATYALGLPDERQTGHRRFTGAINRINSHVQGFIESHGRGRMRFLDCRSFFLSENEDIDEELMPDSAYPNAAGDKLFVFTVWCWQQFDGHICR